MNPTLLSLRSVYSILLILIVSHYLNSQTSDQARGFINRSQTGIFKVQKEILKQSANEHKAGLKKAIQFQVIAVKLYKQNNFKDAVGFSYRSRTIVIELLDKLVKDAVALLNVNDDEKTFAGLKPAGNEKGGQLDQEELAKLEKLDVLQMQQLREFELGIKVDQ